MIFENFADFFIQNWIRYLKEKVSQKFDSLSKPRFDHCHHPAIVYFLKCKLLAFRAENTFLSEFFCSKMRYLNYSNLAIYKILPVKNHQWAIIGVCYKKKSVVLVGNFNWNHFNPSGAYWNQEKRIWNFHFYLFFSESTWLINFHLVQPPTLSTSSY